MLLRKIFFLLFSVQFSFSSCVNANEYNANLTIMNKETHLDTIVFGAGCFWCVEAVFQQINGVLHVTPGYSGGFRKTQLIKRYVMAQQGMRK